MLISLPFQPNPVIADFKIVEKEAQPAAGTQALEKPLSLLQRPFPWSRAPASHLGHSGSLLTRLPGSSLTLSGTASASGLLRCRSDHATPWVRPVSGSLNFQDKGQASDLFKLLGRVKSELHTIPASAPGSCVTQLS